jgi:hypothetical protein
MADLPCAHCVSDILFSMRRAFETVCMIVTVILCIPVLMLAFVIVQLSSLIAGLVSEE